MKSAIKRRLDHDRDMLTRTIASDLKMLRHRVDGALADLAEGRMLDPHLIANSVMLTEQIARWNLVRDLTPMVEDAEEATKPNVLTAPASGEAAKRVLSLEAIDLALEKGRKDRAAVAESRAPGKARRGGR